MHEIAKISERCAAKFELTIVIKMILNLIVLLLIVFIIFLLYMVRKFDYWKIRGVPYIKPIPIFGNIIDICLWRSSIGEFCKQVYAKSSEPFIGFFMLDEPCLIVNDLDIIKNILITDFDNFLNRTMTNNEKHDSIGSNLLFLMKTPKWRDVRRKMTPVFSSGKMKLMTKLMIESAQQMTEYLNEETLRNEIFESRELCGKFTTNTITSTSFGLEGNCFKDENAPFRVIARRNFNWKMIWHAIQTNCFFIAPKLVSLLNMRFIDKVSSNFFREVFWTTMNEREDKKIIRNDLIDILIEMRKNDQKENGEPLVGDVLVAQATQFFVAGYETTSSTMSFALLELARHPKVQERVRDEITRIQKQQGFSYEGFHEMELLENTLLETLRKYPILPFLDRKCTKNYKIPGTELTLLEGDRVYIPVLGIQYDEKFYPDPEFFEPDRFKKENKMKRHNMAFLPFGDGPRNCIGKRYAMLNAKCGLAHILSSYEVKLCDKTEKKVHLSQKGFLLQPEEGIYLQFKKLRED